MNSGTTSWLMRGQDDRACDLAGIDKGSAVPASVILRVTKWFFQRCECGCVVVDDQEECCGPLHAVDALSVGMETLS